MDTTTGIILGAAAGSVIAILSFLGGVYAEGLVQRQKVVTREPEKVPPPQKPEERKEEEKPAPELGAISRPTPEDIEKKENPRLQEEEDAWGEDIDQILHEGIKAMVRHPNFGLNLI